MQQPLRRALDLWCTLPTPMGDFRMYDSETSTSASSGWATFESWALGRPWCGCIPPASPRRSSALVTATALISFASR
jgi:hypothetical protein